MSPATIATIGPDLLARYDRPGPRYTSYPTAVEFATSVSAETYAERLDSAALRGDAPLAVYTHLPFCSARCFFCACHAIATPHPERVREPYLAALKRETELVAAHLGGRRRVAQYHWGGGTPTYFTNEQMADLARHFRSLFDFEPDAEIAVEVDPRVTGVEQLETLRELGFNRVSLGVQDLDDDVQRHIGRVQPFRQTAELVFEARRLGFDGVNVDLIYGLPAQTAESFAATTRTIAALGVDRIAVYSFAYVPWAKKHQSAIDADLLPERDEKLHIFLDARSVLLDAGYTAIGMDHFAKPSDDLARALPEGRLQRNFMGYTTKQADELIGLGISAIGLVDGVYAQNHKKLSRYYAAIEKNTLATERGYVLSRDDIIRADVIKSIMCQFTVDIPAIESRHGIEFQSYFARAIAGLQPMVDDGLVETSPDRINPTAAGQLFVRNIAMHFDRCLETHVEAEKPTFSRTL